MPGAGEYRGAENVELSPLTADRLGELALEAGSRLAYSMWCGATAPPPATLVRHHDVRAVSFTGGTATGRNIMKTPV